MNIRDKSLETLRQPNPKYLKISSPNAVNCSFVSLPSRTPPIPAFSMIEGFVLK
jgi:hypothetical protein